MRVILEVVKGQREGARFVFERHDTFVVGRSKKAQFSVGKDRYFSRYHFMVEANPPQCLLRDLGSTNGTYVNREKVKEVLLSDGDVIRGGLTYIRFRLAEAPAAAEPVGLELDESRASATPALPGRPGRLRCAACGKLAEDTQLGQITDTRMITYVCADCHHQQFDDRHPVANFEVLEELGRGALGPVYKARRLSTDKVVALKLIAPAVERNPMAAKLFLREMQLGARLDHPNIVPIIEIGESGGNLWVATEFVEGVDAAELARGLGGRLPLGDAVDIVCQVLDALEYAHGMNLVHRDVKPSNIMVSGEPGAYRARLADFGLMKNVDEAGLSGITRTGEVRGTVPFMPPEQVVDCRFVKPLGDIYQAGATLYWLLSGQHPHDFDARDARGEVKDPFLVVLEDPVIPLRGCDPSLPEDVAAVVEKALSREPEDRFASAVQMAHALRAAVG